MTTDIDVLRYLKLFAAKTKSGTIDYRTFAAQLQRQAIGADRSVPLFRDLAANPDVVLLPRLKKLETERKVFLNVVGNAVDSIIVPEYYIDLIAGEYRKMEENPDLPFPDEDSLEITIPSSWMLHVPLEGIVAMMESTSAEVPFHKITFSEGLPGFVCPSGFTSGHLHELAVLKLRHYLRQGSNKDYIQKKLSFSFQNKENQLRDAFNSLMVRPFEVVKDLRENANDFSFPFWAYLTSQIRKDLDQKPEKTPEDVSILQAAALCDAYGNYYKGKAQRSVDREAAFKTLAQKFRESPFIFTLEEVTDFRDANHRPLLGKYSREDLEERLHRATTEAPNGKLPELLVLVTPDGKQRFVAKDRLLPLAVRYIGEARQSLRTSIVNEWRLVMLDLASVPPMEDEGAYKADLSSRLEKAFPVFSLLIKDRYLPLVYAELRTSKQVSVELARCFIHDELVPIDELLGLKRKQLYSDVRMMMPLWFSFPFLPFIARLLKAFLGPKPGKRAARKETADSTVSRKIALPLAQARKIEFANAAARIEKVYVPVGVAFEAHMAGLEQRWNTMLGVEAKKNLTEDVEALVRDYLRSMLRSMKPSEFTVERVKSLTSALADTPNLAQIRNRGALEDYLALYMIKLLKR